MTLARLTAAALALVDEFAAINGGAFSRPPHLETEEDMVRFIHEIMPRHATQHDPMRFPGDQTEYLVVV